MTQKAQSPLRQAIWFAAALAAFIGPGALAQPKSQTMPDTGQFIALSGNSKGMLIIDDTAKPGSDGRVMVDTWVVLKAPATKDGQTFEAIYVSQIFDCKAGTYRDLSTGLQNGAIRFAEEWAPKKEMTPLPARSSATDTSREVCNPAPSLLRARFTSYREAVSYARLVVRSKNEVWDKGGAPAMTGRFERLNPSGPTTVLEGQVEQVGAERYARIWLMFPDVRSTTSYRFDNMAMLYAVRCDTRQQRMVRTAAFMGDKFVASDLPFSTFSPTSKGTITDVVVTRICSNVPATVVTDSRATARSWAK